MKHVLFALVLVPVLAWADAPFDGTWLTKIDSIKITGKPDVYLVADGMYTCEACYPTLKIKADGTDQKVTGHAYYDTAAASIVDPHTIQVVTHKDGKMVAQRKFSVSADGKRMTEEFTTYDVASPASGTLQSTRVADGPAGSHALSGAWKPEVKGSTMSSDLMTVTYQEGGEGLKMSSPTGQSYDAKFDGSKVAIAGDPGKTMVALKKFDARTIQETDTRDGKVTDIFLSKVSVDGKTMHVVDDDKMHGTKMSYTAEKQ